MTEMLADADAWFRQFSADVERLAQEADQARKAFLQCIGIELPANYSAFLNTLKIPSS